jgi:plasmid stability protein
MDAREDPVRPFSLRLPQDLEQQLRRDARQHERSVAGSIRAIVRGHFAEDTPVNRDLPTRNGWETRG